MFSACRFARPVRNPGLKFSGGKQKRTKKMEYIMINLSAIEHRAFDNFCYPLDETNLIVNLKTGKEVEKVFILWGDPFDWGKENDASNYHWQFTTVEVTGKKELQNHLWWSITLQPKFKRCKYLFKIQQGDESYIFGESGLVSEEEIAILTTRGATSVSLGTRILRTETAGMAMLAQIMYEVEP